MDGFVGAIPEASVTTVRRFWLVDQPSEIDQLVEAGDEASLRQALELQADHPGVITALAESCSSRAARTTEALCASLPAYPNPPRRGASLRWPGSPPPAARQPTTTGIEARLLALLDQVKDDEEARQAYLDLLEAMDLEDPRRGQFRRALSSRLY